MFQTLLDQITKFFSKPFLIGAFLPTLFFLVLNGAVLSWVYPPFQAWAGDFLQRDGWEQMGAIFRGLLPMFAFSYVLWSLNPALQGIMEGRFLPEWLKSLLLKHQHARFRKLLDELERWRSEHRNLSSGFAVWQADLAAARKTGSQNGAPSGYQPDATLKALYVKRRDGEQITYRQLADAGKKLREALEQYNADEIDELDNDHDRFLRLFDHSAGRAEAAYREFFSEREQEFSPFEVRATRLGNYSESVRGYAQSRYGMDTQVTWSRLLQVIQKENQTFLETLLDQKGQLDFLVAMLWLTVLSTASWLVILPLLSLEREPVLAVGLAGPALAVLFHRVAMMNYRSFAELQRTAIDLFRLKLLTHLEIEPPVNMADERRTWKALTQALVFRDNINLSYRKGGPTS